MSVIKSLICHHPLFSSHDMVSISVIKSIIFDRPFVRHIWKYYMLTPFCHNTHVNLLKCSHVTTLNQWWSHIHCCLEDSFIRNYLMNLFPLYEQRGDLFLSTPDAGDELWGSTTCAGCIICLSTEKTSLYIFLTQHLMHVIICHGQKSMCRDKYRWHCSML